MNSTSISVPEPALASPISSPSRSIPRLASGASWTAAASIAAALSQWVLLMVTAKLGSAEMVGQLALSVAIVAPVQALTDLALRPSLATDARREFQFGDYWRLRATMISVAIIVIAGVAWWRQGPESWIIMAIGLQKAAESASDLCFGLFQREERLDWMGQSVLLRSILASAAFIAVMMASGDLLGACLAGLFVRAGTLVLLDVGRAARLGGWRSPSSTGPARLLRASLPLAVGLFLMSFTVNIPRYFVEKRMGVSALGVFGALIYVFQAGAMLIDAIGQAACVRLGQYQMLAEHNAFSTLVQRLLAIAITMAGLGVIAAVAGAAPLLQLIYSAAFAQAARPFLWLSVCAIPWYCSSILGYVLVARRQMNAIFYCQVVSLGATAAGSYFWIGGSMSAACGVVFLTYSLLSALYVLVLWRGSLAESAAAGGSLK